MQNMHLHQNGKNLDWNMTQLHDCGQNVDFEWKTGLRPGCSSTLLHLTGNCKNIHPQLCIFIHVIHFHKFISISNPSQPLHQHLCQPPCLPAPPLTSFPKSINNRQSHISKVFNRNLHHHVNHLVKLHVQLNKLAKIRTHASRVHFTSNSLGPIKKFGQGPPPFSGNARKKSIFYGRCSLSLVGFCAAGGRSRASLYVCSFVRHHICYFCSDDPSWLLSSFVLHMCST